MDTRVLDGRKKRIAKETDLLCLGDNGSATSFVSPCLLIYC